MQRGFVVIDFETTGLSPRRGDRAVEVAAVCVDPDLHIGDSMETLLNPKRDVGPTRIHGITARDVFDAPTFEEVAPSLLQILDGNVIVGHNISFDLRFLEAELERAGYQVPGFVALDTLRLSKTLLCDHYPQSYKLKDICSCLGFGVSDVFTQCGLDQRPEHSALGDAMVTSFLLGRLIEMSSGSSFWHEHLDRAQRVPWPQYFAPPKSRTKRRGESSVPPKPSATDRSVQDVLHALGTNPYKTETDETYEYSRLLDDSLQDRVLDADEIEALADLAQAHGLDEVTLGSLHRGHFDAVVRDAWADGVLTDEEQRDIARVADLLGIDPDSLNSALSGPNAERDAERQSEGCLPAGSPVVLTGEMSRERSILEGELIDLGFTVGKGVTKKTALLIAADPYTQSGKAKKARQYGIPVVGEYEGFALLRNGHA